MGLKCKIPEKTWPQKVGRGGSRRGKKKEGLEKGNSKKPE